MAEENIELETRSYMQSKVSSKQITNPC